MTTSGRVSTPFLRRKSVEAVHADTAAAGGLRRSLGVTRLSLIGVSSTIGTGIFFIFGVATPLAGPAVVLSFLVAALAAALSALCYAELTSTLPTAGSAYSAAYVALGEGMALILASCLLLEYGIAISAIAVTWAQYVNQLSDLVFGVSLPRVLSAAPSQGGYVNLPAVALICMAALLLLRGVRQSATANAIMVAIKIGVLLVFVAVGVKAFNAGNFHPFAPHGMGGVGAAASLIFFAFIGVDSIATAGEEAVNPQRTLPLALLVAMLVVTGIYVAVAVVAIGAQPVSEFAGQQASLAVILQNVTKAAWPSFLLSAGAIVSIFSISLVLLYSQTRVMFAVSRDGLLPRPLSRVNLRTGAPVLNTLLASGIAIAMAGFMPLELLADMVSVGTLGAFILVAVSVIALRVRQPDLPRPFRAPLFPLLPLLSIALCMFLLLGLARLTLIMFAVWLAAVLIYHYLYAGRRSRLSGAAAEHGEARAS